MATRQRGVRPGPEPPAGIADDVPDAIPADVARTIVLRSLNQAPRTRKQLADLLEKRLVSTEVSGEVLDRFVEVGLVNDREFAENWVRSRHSVRGLTRRVLRQELRQKGISDIDADAALEQIDEESEYSAAVEFATRKLRSLSRYDEPAQRRRLMGMLMRRGYGGSVAASVVSQVLANEGCDDDVW
ncbi:MAG TPA: recombination regulator RecX [Actinobacteria bacterium]|nr:recombination regulator RecX [Actinomycetota bacterium]